jgi:hypothetical protein
MNHPTSRTNVVYRRTTKGQAAAMRSGWTAMDEESRKLLLLVNGFTSLDALAKVGQFHEGPEGMADALKTSGLIEESQEHHHMDIMRAPWRTTERQ